MGCNTVEVRAEPRCLFEVYPEKNLVDVLGTCRENMLEKKTWTFWITQSQESKMQSRGRWFQAHGILCFIFESIWRTQTMTPLCFLQVSGDVVVPTIRVA